METLSLPFFSDRFKSSSSRDLLLFKSFLLLLVWMSMDKTNFDNECKNSVTFDMSEIADEVCNHIYNY